MFKHYIFALTLLLSNFAISGLPNTGTAHAQNETAPKKKLLKKNKPKLKKRLRKVETEEDSEGESESNVSGFYLQGAGSYVTSEVHELDTTGFQGTFLASYRTPAMFGLGIGINYLSLSAAEEFADISVSSMATVLEFNFRFPVGTMFAVEPYLQVNYGVSNQLEIMPIVEVTEEPITDLTGMYWGGLGLRLGAEFTPHIEGLFELTYLGGASTIYEEGSDGAGGYYTEESTKKLTGFSAGAGVAIHF